MWPAAAVVLATAKVVNRSFYPHWKESEWCNLASLPSCWLPRHYFCISAHGHLAPNGTPLFVEGGQDVNSFWCTSNASGAVLLSGGSWLPVLPNKTGVWAHSLHVQSPRSDHTPPPLPPCWAQLSCVVCFQFQWDTEAVCAAHWGGSAPEHLCLHSLNFFVLQPVVFLLKVGRRIQMLSTTGSHMAPTRLYFCLVCLCLPTIWKYSYFSDFTSGH